LIAPERVNPFPNFVFLIHNGAYYNTGTYINDMHKLLKEKLELT
jgi:hypothetical protein